MTAAEMIEELSKLDPDEIIYTNDPGCGCCGFGAVEASLDYSEEFIFDESELRYVWMVS